MSRIRRVLILPPALVLTAMISALLAAAPEDDDRAAALRRAFDESAQALEQQVIAWRRDFHEHPELGNQETRTAARVAEHLRRLGIETRTGVGGTGVVGVLRGASAEPVVALRADMDALPVAEETDLPFASKVRAEFNGQQVGVMHACGHDAHVAILMGAAEILAGMRDRLPGSVVFIFQPAEEGVYDAPEWGANLMIKQGALENPRPREIFGLHVTTLSETGVIATRPAGVLAASDDLRIVVRGRQTHASLPWNGVDPIVAASQIVMGLQTVISRQTDLTRAPAVVTIGIIQGGVRNNIIPDSVEMHGTIRTLETGMQEAIHAKVKHTAETIAASSGATAEVVIEKKYPVTHNDPDLTRRMGATLARVAGPGRLEMNMPPWLGAEDFSYFQQKVPGLYITLGVRKPGASLLEYAPNHSPRFRVDESALIVGVRAMGHLAIDSLAGAP
ncbi:MAG TPA: amidohydrolase [Candidatus Polarisedimenticolia bacterium]|nr:amidohydrolase [Candidatus Polarisedimenticolia bacterium]